MVGGVAARAGTVVATSNKIMPATPPQAALNSDVEQKVLLCFSVCLLFAFFISFSLAIFEGTIETPRAWPHKGKRGAIVDGARCLESIVYRQE
jgi:hypothetical protein